MAQVIQFPTGATLANPAPPTSAAPKTAKVSHAISPIRKKLRVPQNNRPEDEGTILLAGLARSFADRAHTLAQVEPNSEGHRLAIHMAGISAKLPRNNLRLFVTPPDALIGVWMLWRKVKLACLEWELCDLRRMEGIHEGNEDARNHWSAKSKEAEQFAWLQYERLVRVPARSLTEFKRYKLDRRCKAGMGDMEWMREQKPELAAILDEELARHTAVTEARKARLKTGGEA